MYGNEKWRCCYSWKCGSCRREPCQRAIEEALNSPLLNDNDIRGAKWILININSAEGEHEFTMDEVEVIQNYLLTQAGEKTDVILGLGYDNSLGEHIGITLIATGFQHKDPFILPVVKKPESNEEKIVMVLGQPQETKQEEKMEVIEEKEKLIKELQRKNNCARNWCPNSSNHPRK